MFLGTTDIVISLTDSNLQPRNGVLPVANGVVECEIFMQTEIMQGSLDYINIFSQLLHI